MSEDEKNKENKDEKETEGASAGEEMVFEDLEENPKDALKKLREKLKVCVAEKQEYLEGWQRARADYINARKAEEKEKAEILTMAKEKMFSELLPVLDSFELAFSNKEAWEKIDKNWRLGVESIYGKFSEILNANGVKEISGIGEKFNPEFHQAVESIMVEEKEKDGLVAQVVQKGYQIGGKVVRPSKVKVNILK